MKDKKTAEDLFGPVIFSYTRAEAINDGVLVDVTSTPERTEAGIKYPVALTRTVYDKYVDVPENCPTQDIKGRLWDMLFMFKMAALRTGESILTFELYVVTEAGKKAELVTLKAVCGPGDTAEPVITIMLPTED